MREDVKVRDMSEELKKWEKEMAVVLGRYLKVVEEILAIVRGKEDGWWEVVFTSGEGGGGGGGGGGLEVKEMKKEVMGGMKQELARFFSA